jgi:hypothetical protein
MGRISACSAGPWGDRSTSLRDTGPNEERCRQQMQVPPVSGKNIPVTVTIAFHGARKPVDGRRRKPNTGVVPFLEGLTTPWGRCGFHRTPRLDGLVDSADIGVTLHLS